LHRAAARKDLNRDCARPYGRLCVYATQMVATTVLTPVWARFLATYPDVPLEVQVSEASADIVVKGFDAGLGLQDRAAADMTILRVMGPVKVAMVGACPA
jgi:DNA-binding transcriptional LysR family regulator